MNIEEFLTQYGVDATIWQEWLRVQFAPKPETQPVWPKSDEPFFHQQLDPSPEFKRACELRVEFAAVIRSKLNNGRWEVTGRPGDAASRQRLERVDWTHLKVDFANNSIGGYRHIDIQEFPAVSHDEVLQRFIEKLCETAMPGEKLTKPLISNLAAALYPDAFQANAFGRAWVAAKIDERWRRSGRR